MYQNLGIASLLVITKSITNNYRRRIKMLLTINEVAEMLKISVSTLYRWVNKREIPFVKLGGKLRFNEDEIKTLSLIHI